MVSKDGFLGRTIEPYKFGGRSVGGMMRVITMYSIILFRTIHAALYIIRNGVRGRTVSLIVGCIFGVIGTIFVIMSVAALGAAQGRRRVLGINWGRLHFDVVLGLGAVASLALMIVAFLFSSNVDNSGLFSAWCIVWVFLSLTAWIAQKPPTMETYV
ncbi:hypothetical protein B0T11DRAFT_141898 [Plectosphaerella cucumerina]|uniref:Uncharacterized protein n=1 Tax=Plectosphaerella cucumerina TaxID=40658 RepID=A0A8K0TA82_9PEZI|nr:hypothetical protein B0T11DRAFT_141898 [Plectosphaerella cucumerina]